MSTIQDSSGGYTGAYVTYTYDNRGRRTQIARGNGTSTTYAYDNADRLISLNQNVSGTGAVTYANSYNSVGQVLASSLTNSAYISHPSTPSTSYTANGLNQYSSVAGASFTYDTKGNLTSDGTRGFNYDAENRLTGENVGTQSVSLSYDPAGRLNETVGSATSQFVFSGQRLIAEYDGAGHVLRRYVPGSGLDNPVIWYEGAGYTSRNWLHTDPHGSVIAYTNDSGAVQASYGYGPYGEPSSWSGSRYRYTGQIEIPEAQLYYYKARVYDPAYGRFPQTDPIGYRDDTNAYGYTHDDPVNRKDPRGMDDCGSDEYDTIAGCFSISLDTISVGSILPGDDGDDGDDGIDTAQSPPPITVTGFGCGFYGDCPAAPVVAASLITGLVPGIVPSQYKATTTAPSQQA